MQPSMNASMNASLAGRYALAIIGGGPSSTYVVGQLAAIALKSGLPAELAIEIFDRSGEFGAGEVHSPRQPASSVLNRVAGQIAFAADESNWRAGSLLPLPIRPSFHEWCRQKFAATGLPDFELAPEDWPKRYVHGLALRDLFERYVAELRTSSGVEVRCHHDSVLDVQRTSGGRFRIVTARESAREILADHVLFATGHSYNDPVKSPETARLVRFEERGYGVSYTPYAYPLEQRIPPETTTPESTVGVAGLGVTAIDVILYLTEDRGGKFVPAGERGKLRYVSSGREPCSIVAFGTTGLFTFARPFNAKEQDISRLEHKGVFLTSEAITRLRESQGRTREVSPLGARQQVSFDRHVFPLVVLEMAYIYYSTLYGQSVAANIRRSETQVYENFLACGAGERDVAIDRLLAPVQSCAREAEEIVASALAGIVVEDAPGQLGRRDVVMQYMTTVFGDCLPPHISDILDRPQELAEVLSGTSSPWGHPREPQAHRFDWRRLADPISLDAGKDGERFTAAVIDFMEWDHLQALQDNVRNPFKAACDGVWRDLRPVIADAIDFGGLDAPSHRKFLEVYMRHHNRLANGAGLAQMQKILALIRAGVLDISVGPGPRIDVDPARKRFIVRGSSTGEVREVTALIDARIHQFNPDDDASPLFRNLIAQGLIRK